MANVGFGDGARDNLRTMVAAVDREISQLPPTGEGTRAADALRVSWDELVKLLALGPAPEIRECPVCNGTGMRAATRCAHCWTKLEPLAPATTDVPRNTV